MIKVEICKTLMLIIYLQRLQRIVANQFARNVWSTGLEVNSNAAKTVFIKAGNLNWATATLAQQDEMMFATLILVITTTVPTRSILVDNPYRGVPSKKLQSFLDVTEKDEDTDDSTRPLFNYVNFKVRYKYLELIWYLIDTKKIPVFT